MCVVFQNDKTGIFKTHKQKYSPSISDFEKLVDELIKDSGMMCLMINENGIHFDFKNGIIIRLKLDNDEKQFITDREIDKNTLMILYKSCLTSR